MNLPDNAFQALLDGHITAREYVILVRYEVKVGEFELRAAFQRVAESPEQDD